MLNERNKENKAKKSKWEDERDEADDQGIEAADADRERRSQRQNADRYKDHAHGKFGEKRGAKKAKGAKSPIQGRLARVVKRTKSEEGKKARAKEVMKKNLMSHTVYQDMGMLMAESLGLVSESTRKDTYGGTGPDRGAKTPYKRKESSEPKTKYQQSLERQTAQQTPDQRKADVEDVYTRAGQRKRAKTGERRYVAGVASDPSTKVTIKAAKKGPKKMKTSGRKRAR